MATKRKNVKVKKYVYLFGKGITEGNAEMKELLGGKGANLAEMALLGLPVPPGFTITTEVCTYFYENNRKYPDSLKEEVERAIQIVERQMGRKFGDKNNPLLVSVRSGARISMPGMMETVLNVGLNDEICEGLIRQTSNPRFVYDAYRRLIQMYSDVVMEKAEGIEPEEGKGIRQQLENELQKMLKQKGLTHETQLSPDDLKELISIYKLKVKEVLGRPFPEDPYDQLWQAIGAVFLSWNGKRAVSYRRIEGIPDWWGTAVNVQSMVYGNMGETSGTGVAFTRNPATGENVFYGEWLPNAQGEDVVAGIRTPYPINKACKTPHNQHLPSLEEQMPEVYNELLEVRNILERHYRDMLDIEFTIQEGKLFMLQCRVGKRNGPAAVRMALDMVKEKLITPEEAVLRVKPSQLDELLHPLLDPQAEKAAKIIGQGLPAGPGGATGQVVFSAKDAVEWTNKGHKVILVREETNPEDIDGMRAAVAILTGKGGMTSHAALVARGWGKTCVVGAGNMHIDVIKKELIGSDGSVVREGDWISLNGSKGIVYLGQLPLTKSAEENPDFVEFMKLCDKIRKLKVRTNADTPEDAKKAREFGAEGIGLFRTEHMFYGEGSDIPLFLLRKMIIAKTEEERRKSLEELFPYMKKDVKGTLEVMDGLPVTFRTLDPPLHEFIPHNPEERKKLAESLNISLDELNKRADSLHETNPMMGNRGVRLGIIYPEITETQVRAIFEATAELLLENKKPFPEIMIPVTCNEIELKHQLELVKKVHDEVCKKYNLKSIPHSFGTMIEVPRAALIGDKMAEYAEFFSFGTNDLTQMTFAFSRDDIGSFLPEYLNKKVLAFDPFQHIDKESVGVLMKECIEKGRSKRKDLKVGICGEHGGDPESVIFCHQIGLNYVSCSPYRVPIARLAAAQAAALEKLQRKKQKPKTKKAKKK